MKAFKPAVRTDSSFNLIRARHPLIDPQKCVPVDIALGGEYDSLIITGPNTGGKTVTLKTAGLLCACTVRFLIPADERSEICVFDEFLVDIGDEQSIEQSLSTFSGHMKKSPVFWNWLCRTPLCCWTSWVPVPIPPRRRAGSCHH